MIKTKQTSIKLHDYKGDVMERWYISYTYFSKKSNKNKRVKIYMGLNFTKTASGRYEESKNIIGFIKSKIQDGWNPDEMNLEDFVSGGKDMDESSITFKNALRFALTKGSWSSATKKAYTLTQKYFIDSAEEIGLSNKLLGSIKRRDIKLLSENVQRKKNWSNKNINKNIGYLKALMSKLVEYDFIETNPCLNIKPLPEVEAVHYEPLTKEEKIKLQDSLMLKHYRFYVFCMVIYYTGIRPKEVRSLKIKDFNLKKREITIIPDLALENSKTKKIRHVPIVENLYIFLKQFNMENENKDFFCLALHVCQELAGAGK